MSMAPRRSPCAVLGLLALCLAVRAAAGADDGKPPAASSPGNPPLKEIKAALDGAEKLLADGRPAKAAAALASVAEQLGQVAAGGRPPAGLRPLLDRCKSLKGALELEGVDVAAIAIPSLKAGAKATDVAKAPPENGRQDPAKKKPEAVAGRPPAAKGKPPAVSFSGEVAPLLVRSCGGCHIMGRKGGFQFASYADLMQTGVVQPGVGEASRLVEVILSGDMPRGGGKVTPDEVGLLMRWIDGGAGFDGPDPRQALAALGRPAAPPPRAAKPVATLVSKLEPGAVSFSMDVAPVLIASCYTCHGGNETEQGFSMKTFERLLAGGRSGAAIEAGKAAESLLVKKLKGPVGDGQRMPLNRPALPNDVIAMIERWIAEGARLDARSAAEELPTLAAAGRSRKLSHEDLAAVRFTAAKNLWSRALPDEEPEMAGSADVRVIGNLSAARMKAVETMAGDAWQVARRELGGDAVPLKGGVVVFAFAKGFDLSEFWQVRYGKERPQGVVGAGGVVGDVVYAAVALPADDGDDDAKLLVTEQMMAAIVAARAAPAWFAEGVGRAVAARAHPRAARARAWKTQTPDALAAVGSAEAFFVADPEEREATRTVAGAFVGSLIAPGRRLRLLVAAVDAGTPFDQAFVETFGGPPAQLFAAWAAKEAAGSRRR